MQSEPEIRNPIFRMKGMTDLAALVLCGVSLGTAAPLWAADARQAAVMVENVCSTCHKFEGEPESRFKLKAPDLMWAGNKYRHEWLVGFLAGNEKPLYAKSYRWDQGWEPERHMALPEEQAEAVAAWLETRYIDPRVQVGAFDVSKVTRQEAAFGAAAYREHACIGCHTIEENGRLVGGPQSVDLSESGRRYNPDWVFRFAINPQDFTPHSGEFLADATGFGVRAIVGYLLTLGVPDFSYDEPWTGPEFAQASVERGQVVYREYCSQCHGATGEGDGPGASGLSPKPAAHARMAFDRLPTEYLYNVIYHGGRSVGKSASMPYWNLTIGRQGVADVMAYLKATFKGGPESTVAATVGGPSGVCPQPRRTKRAPGNVRTLTNPLPANAANLKAGESLFQQTAQPLACMNCHGSKGDGQGPMGAALNPPPRNFTCGETMRDLSDGQMFWITKHGSMGTGMLAFSGMSDNQVWQVIHYIRTLAQ